MAELLPESSFSAYMTDTKLSRFRPVAFATEQPSCYNSWVGIEQHTDAMQTNRAVCLFYALTGQFDRRGSNVLFASTPTNYIMGHELLPPEQAARRLGAAERPLGPAGNP